MSPAERLLEFCLRVERSVGRAVLVAVGRVRDQDQTEPALALFSFGIKQLPDISVAPGLRLPLRPVDIVSLSSLSLKAPGPSSSSVSPYPSNKGVWENRCSGVSYRRSVRVLPSAVVPRAEVIVCESYLVDPASSHMLVSKTKPCMSKYERFIQ